MVEALPRRSDRPKTEKRVLFVTPRLDPEGADAFYATGPGWRTRINVVLALAI
ncbi:BrnA antitoxin family protein [Methylobacterium terricola]|uniref:BrnA antitoxin family protein n=1 Tax=Methylobacterium terricola TaxID=2583531 RepID=A0A5C4LL20_9HYPH|nr:BrnA antitoxin family protein [Methylobacterium terricola]TNC15207.1 BrnA antitoxin family protein [Methylobacterium terricola]